MDDQERWQPAEEQAPPPLIGPSRVEADQREDELSAVIDAYVNRPPAPVVPDYGHPPEDVHPDWHQPAPSQDQGGWRGLVPMAGDAASYLGRKFGVVGDDGALRNPGVLGAAKGVLDVFEDVNEATAQSYLGSQAGNQTPLRQALDESIPGFGYFLGRRDRALASPEAQAAYARGDNVGAWDAAADNHLTGVEKWAFETGFDPTTWTGAGLGKQGGKSLPLVGPVAGPVLGAADAVAGAATGALPGAALAAFKGGLWGANKAIGGASDLLHATPLMRGGGVSARALANEANDRVSDALREVGARGHGWADLSNDAKAVYGDLSEGAARLLGVGFPAIETHAKNALRDKAWLEALTNRVEQAVPAAGGVLRSAPDAGEWLQRAKAGNFLQPADLKTAEEKIGQWSGDLLKDDPLSLIEGAVHRANNEALGYLGPMGGVAHLPGLGGVAKALGDLTSLWKEQALISPRYLGQNAVSAGVMGTIAGVDPGALARSGVEMTVKPLMASVQAAGLNPAGWFRRFRAEAAKQAETGVFETPRQVQAAMDQWGLALPASLEQKATNPLTDGGRSLKDVPLLVRSGLAALAGAPAGLPGTAAGAVYGAVAPHASATVRFLSEIVEGTARRTGWMVGTEEAVQKAMPEFLQAVSSRIAALPDMGMAPSSVMADWARRAIEATGGRISVQGVQDVLTRAGATPEIAADAAKGWANVLAKASAEGERLAMKANFDYARPDNLESALRYASPFVIWPKRAVGFFLEAMRDNPAVFVALNTLRREANDDSADRGSFTKRTIGWGSDLAEAIYGRAGQMVTNPFELFSPFGRMGDDVNEKKSQADRIVQTLGNYGLGLNPLVQEGLHWAGATEPSPAGLTMINQRLRPFADVDAEKSWRSAVERGLGGEGLVNTIGGLFRGEGRVSPVSDYAVKRRIDEMVVERFDDTLHGPNRDVAALRPYRKAYDTLRGPIADQARADVLRARQGQAVHGWVNPGAGTFESATEARVMPQVNRLPEAGRDYARDAQGNVHPAGTQAANDRVRRENPLSTTYKQNAIDPDADVLVEAAKDYRTGARAGIDAAFAVEGFRAYYGWAKAEGVPASRLDDRATVLAYLHRHER